MALISCVAGLDPHFKLPRFEVLDKDGDGSFSDKEAGQFLLDTGECLFNYVGEQIFLAFAPDGEISRDEYEMLEDGIRKRARWVLQRFNESMPQLESKVISGMRQLQSHVIVNMKHWQHKAQGYLEVLQQYLEDPTLIPETQKGSPKAEFFSSSVDSFKGKDLS